jgi:hypothetical protein
MVVLPGHEGPDLDAGWPRRLLAEWERDALLEEIPLVAEAGARSGLVVALVGLEDPEHDQAAARSGDVLDRPLEQRNLDAGGAAYLGVHDHAGGPVGRGEAVAAVHVREADRPVVVGREHARRVGRDGALEVTPDRFAERRVPVGRFGLVVQAGRGDEVSLRDRLQHARLDHCRRGYPCPLVVVLASLSTAYRH